MEDSQRIIELLEAILKQSFSDYLTQEFQDKDKQQIFELTGKYSQDEIKKRLKVGSAKITKCWSEWELRGIIKKEGNKYKKIF